MSVKVITHFGTVLRLASELAEAEKTGDQEAIAKAKSAHDDYVELCKTSNEMCLGLRRGDL